MSFEQYADFAVPHRRGDAGGFCRMVRFDDPPPEQVVIEGLSGGLAGYAASLLADGLGLPVVRLNQFAADARPTLVIGLLQNAVDWALATTGTQMAKAVRRNELTRDLLALPGLHRQVALLHLEALLAAPSAIVRRLRDRFDIAADGLSLVSSGVSLHSHRAHRDLGQFIAALDQTRETRLGYSYEDMSTRA